MKPTGRAVRSLLLFIALFTASLVQADFTAKVDRDRVIMGDSLRLTITATGNEQIGNLDHRPLLKDFEILQRSTSSSTSIVNGTRTSTRQVILEITPRRTGTLTVPALRAGAAETNFLIVSVSPAADGFATDQTVSFEAELEYSSVYVQGQVLLTLRIMQSINLESRSVTELQLDNAFVKQLEQKSFQRTIDGRPWLVHEIRYAIFPEESGVLEIPSQTFSARESTGRRGMMSFGSGGRALNRKTKALSLKVLPRPDAFPGTTWLPARKLEIQESWSTPPEQLHTGESATRTIVILGEGLQGAQLPPMVFPATEGLKYYPDQPVIGETESSSGLTGSRRDSAALIPTREGSWTIPEVRIPWWDTKAEKVRYAVLPERQITVTPGDYIQLDSAPIKIVGPAAASPASTAIPTTAANDNNWKSAAIVASLGWFATLLYLWLSRRKQLPPPTEPAVDLTEKKAFKRLQGACAAGNASFARSGIIHWAASLAPQAGIHSLEDVAALFADAALGENLSTLNTQLYSSDSEGNATWDAGELGQIAQRLRKHQQATSAQSDQALKLYPA